MASFISSARWPRTIGNMHRPSARQALLLVVSGIFLSWPWVRLFGLWVVYDTPLVKLGYSLGLSGPAVTWISLSLFAFLSAVLCTVPIWLLTTRSFHISAVVFCTAFLLAFLISSIVSGQGVSYLASFTTLWLFVLFFGLCVLLISWLRHAPRA